MAMLVSLTSFAAALGDGYSKVTDITTLSAGDKVVVYCDASSIGVTGWNGSKDANVAATGWVEYLVEAATNGVYLKDEGANNYIASPGSSNQFKYGTKAVCSVDANGVLKCNSRFLCHNGNNGNYYRMYTSIGSYKPFYVYKVLAEGELKAPVINGEVEFETSTTVTIEVSEGLKAYYTLDGTEPTTASTEYTAPFELTETTTVTAVAYDEAADQLSEVSTVTFKKLQVLTCAEAAALCTSTASADKYIIKGYVTSIAVAYDASYNNVSFWMADTEDGGKVIEPYRAIPTTAADKAVKVGDYVVVIGNLVLYSGTPEVNSGCKFTITEAPAKIEPCTEATPVNWDDKIELEANADKWYLMDLTTAIEAGKDLEFNLVNTSADSVVVTVEAHDACPTDEFTLLQSSTQTIEANASKSKVLGYADFLAGQVEQMYIHVITKGGALSLDMEQVEPAPTTETVYFVNAQNWTGTINAYAWDPVQNANWPGVAATKEAEQIGGYDVYSYTAEAGTYKNIIFNGTGGQTADLVWTAGKYYVKDGWYTKEEAEAQLAKPVEYESVYFVNAQGWSKVNIYTWTPEVGGWPGVAMTKEAEQIAGYDVYSYTVEKGTSFGGMLFNNTNGVQTADLKWTAGQYFVKDKWYTKEEAEALLSGPVTPPVITYVLMGVAGDWTTGIAMTVNPDNENEYVLLGQEIAEGDADRKSVV